jgi:1-deoxy-D-xylulose 5-phosphate reductoisomerase
MDICALQNLSFFPPDMVRFPCLRLAFDSLAQGGTAACIVNAANEIAVASFLQSTIGFLDIPRLIETCLEKITHIDTPSLAESLVREGMSIPTFFLPKTNKATIVAGDSSIG